MTLGFNWQYLQEFLNNVGTNEIAAVSSEPEAKETDGDKVRVRETAGPILILMI